MSKEHHEGVGVSVLIGGMCSIKITSQTMPKSSTNTSTSPIFFKHCKKEEVHLTIKGKK